MKNKTLLVSGLVLVLISCVFFAGCSDNSSPANTTTQVTSAPGSPRYVTGDIVRNPAYETGWLILGYNSSTDSYQRAQIYPNADGSWGYRTSSGSDTISRVSMEKTITEKITNKLPSSIPIKRPTVATTSTTSTSTVSATTTSATTTTTLTTGKPTFKKIVPDEGTAGTIITIESLTGTNFRDGATVLLMKADNPNITATNVNVKSSTLMTCTFAPPANATAGAWNIVITNPDGQFVNFSYEFTLHAPIDTSTTTAADSQEITSINPTFTIGNNVEMLITGSGFQSGNINAKLTKSTGSVTLITARNVAWHSETQVTAYFTIPKNSKGIWTVVVTNPDGTTRTLLNGFEVKA